MKNTKQKIQKIAFELFVKKGYDGVSFQDIADKAGVTKAMLNYYFRNKEKLLITIFSEALEKYFIPNFQVFESPIPLEQKLEKFIDQSIDTFIRHPQVPLFIADEINRHSDILRKTLEHFGKDLIPTVIENIKQNLKNEYNVPESQLSDAVLIITDIISLTLFPFIVRPGLINLCTDGSATQFRQMMIQKKEHIKKLILLYIKSLK